MTKDPASSSALPYTDTKPVGAADFYFGINSTFRFIINKLGYETWVRYLKEMGQEYYAPVTARWKSGGMPAVAEYWKAFFAAEPGSEVEVKESPGRVDIEVKVCPAIKHFKDHKREITKEYCHHCYHLGNTRAGEAGMAMRLEGGNGSCHHTYFAKPSDAAPQDMKRIREAKL